MFPKPCFSLLAHTVLHWLAAAGVISALMVSSAWSATFLVRNASDIPDADLTDDVCSIVSGSIFPEQCTLRAAIQQANALAGADIINIDVPTVNLGTSGRNENEAATGDLDITDDVQIIGVNTSTPVITWNNVATNDERDRVFHVVSEFSTALTKPVVTFDNLIIQGGYIDTALGAGIRIDGGIITILSSEIINNTAFTSDTPPENPEPDPDSGGITSVATGGGIYIGRDATVTIEASRIASNTATTAAGGIDNLGRLTISSNSEISGNTSAGTGGGIRNFGGFMNIGQVLITDNTAPSGGGVYNVTAAQNVGSAVISNASIDANQASQIGGGIFNAGPLTVTNSAIVRNRSSFNAGGIFNGALGNIDLVNSTISGNRATAIGGGIENTRVVNLTNITIFDNQAGIDEFGNPGGNQIYIKDTDGTVANTDPELILVNTIVANNDEPSDACGGIAGYRAFINSRGSNMENGDTCGFTGANDLINVAELGIDPALDIVLPDDIIGESTAYHALQSNSPAIDSGNTGFCPSVDQRFLFRDEQCDIGAYEFNASQFVSGDVVDLKVTLDDTPDPVAPNDEFRPLTYIVAVQNILDNGTAIDTSVEVQLPASVNFANINADSGVDCLAPDANNVVVCNLGNINPLQRVEVFISTVPTAEGTITATATTSSSVSQDIFNNNNQDSEETQVTFTGTSNELINFNGRQGGGGGALSLGCILLAAFCHWHKRVVRRQA